MLKICIIGTGQIGYDLLIKLMKINFVKIIAFVGKRKYLKELPENIFYSDKSIEFFKLNPNCCDVVFDCTDSFSAIINNEVFLQQNIKVIDLTPSKIGEYYIPNMNNKLGNNINMVTCGGQVSIPAIKYLYDNCSDIKYVEIVTQIASNSAGLATRINIDKYIETTESAIYHYINIKKCKVILNLNPFDNKIFQTTIYLKTSYYNSNTLNEFSNTMKNYIPNYNVEQPIWIEDDVLMMNINIIGSEDYLSKYFGNLDIINCAAIHALKTIYKEFN